MNIKEFVEKYEAIATNSLKEDFVKDNVKIKDYVPYIEKVTRAKKLVKLTSLDADGNIKFDSTTQSLLFCRMMIEEYTDLEVETQGFFEEYDLLKKSGALSKVFALIPEAECEEFNVVTCMVQDDFVRNNCEAHAYVAAQVERFGNLIGTALRPALDSLTETIANMDDAKIEKIGKQISKFITRVK